ncbi:MAG: sugar kinase [Brevibacillus sp.]|nr:sugar kinase [Brevibacillus sp.]
MDVVTFGETMVLFHPVSVGPLRFAAQFEKTIGGAESNVAIGLARLGHQVSWVSRLGDDEFGLFIRNFIRGEGVDTSHVVFDLHHPTAVFFKERQHGKEPKVYYYRKDSAASRLKPEDISEELIAKAKFLHVTGITPALSATCREAIYQAIDKAKRHRVTVVFDPNVRLKLWKKEEARVVLADIAGKCDIVLPGWEEGRLLTGEETPERIAERLLQKGTKAVVIKLGERGAYYATANEKEYVSGFPVDEIVDPIGAGDGFAAGFLSGLLRGWSYRDAVRLGNRIGAYALTVAGDVEGYPFWSQVMGEHEEVHR